MIQKQKMLFKSSVSFTFITITIQEMSLKESYQQKKLSVLIHGLPGDPCTKKYAQKWPVLPCFLFPIGCQQSLLCKLLYYH